VLAYRVAGSAASGADYVALSGTVTIPAGQTTADVDVAALEDALVEGTETGIVTLSDVTSGDPQVTLHAANTSAPIDLADDDTATRSITSATRVAEQGGAQAIAVTLTTSDGAGGTATLAPNVTLEAEVADLPSGTAGSGADYAPFGVQRVLFGPGSGDG